LSKLIPRSYDEFAVFQVSFNQQDTEFSKVMAFHLLSLHIRNFVEKVEPAVSTKVVACLISEQASFYSLWHAVERIQVAHSERVSFRRNGKVFVATTTPLILAHTFTQIEKRLEKELWFCQRGHNKFSGKISDCFVVAAFCV